MFGGKYAKSAIVGMLAALVVLGTAAPASTAAPRRTQSSQLEAAVLSQINTVRREHGLASLRVNSRLTAAAVQHSQDMGARGYFKHESADGSAFWKRVERFYASTKYRFWSVGENLLWSSPDVDGAGAIDMWMNSPPHRANLLNGRWREVGISAVHVMQAPGAYRGLDVTIVTADFGVRR
jgi:uncharacterized protein YkwD